MWMRRVCKSSKIKPLRRFRGALSSRPKGRPRPATHFSGFLKFCQHIPAYLLICLSVILPHVLLTNTFLCLLSSRYDGAQPEAPQDQQQHHRHGARSGHVAGEPTCLMDGEMLLMWPGWDRVNVLSAGTQYMAPRGHCGDFVLRVQTVVYLWISFGG